MLFSKSIKVTIRRNRNRNNQMKIPIRRKTRKGVGKKTYFLWLFFGFLFSGNYILIIKKGKSEKYPRILK